MPWRITYRGRVEYEDYDTEGDAIEAAECYGLAYIEPGGTDHNPHKPLLVLGDGYDIEEYDEEPSDEQLEAMNPFSEYRREQAGAAEERYRKAQREKR